jgi:hypothetical protein
VAWAQARLMPIAFSCLVCCLLPIACSPCTGHPGVRAGSSPCRSLFTGSSGARAGSSPCRSPCTGASGARAAVYSLALLAPVLAAVARAAVLALVLVLAPVLAVARAAVLAYVLIAPVLALPCHPALLCPFHQLPALTAAKLQKP